MFCVRCKEKTEQEAREKVSFRALCDRCGACLHCCEFCKYYQVGQPNDCKVPGSDRVRDRSANNFCEEFSPLQHVLSKSNLSKTTFEDLFR